MSVALWTGVGLIVVAVGAFVVFAVAPDQGERRRAGGVPAQGPLADWDEGLLHLEWLGASVVLMLAGLVLLLTAGVVWWRG